MKIEQVGHQYNREEVFKNIKLVINRGDKIALIGENGSGKSTLLKIIAAKLEPEAGKVNTDKWDTLEYAEQEPFSSIDQKGSVSDYLTEQGYNLPSLQRRAVELGFSDFDRVMTNNQIISSLSGGQKKMLALAIATSENPDTLVLDEPENHLDIISRKRLAKILSQYKGKLIFVSHDQFIIDAVSNKIAFLEDKELSMFGDKDYDEVKESKQVQKTKALKDWKNEKRDIERLKKALVIMQLKARFSTKGQGVYQSRKRDIERRLEEMGEKPKTDTFQMFFPSHQVERKGKKMISNIIDLTFRFEGTTADILRGVNLKLVFGERLGLMGRNGSGKTTLLKLMLGEISPTSGNVALGNDINIGYFGQIEDNYDKKSPLSIFEDSGLNTQKSHAACANLGLSEAERKIPYSKMSGGQQTRLRLALLAIKNPDFVILDEPTNHLDTQSCDFVMEFLSEYRGTLLVVSHDQVFLNSIGLTKFWIVKDGTVTEDVHDLEDVIKTMEV